MTPSRLLLMLAGLGLTAWSLAFVLNVKGVAESEYVETRAARTGRDTFVWFRVRYLFILGLGLFLASAGFPHIPVLYPVYIAYYVLAGSFVAAAIAFTVVMAVVQGPLRSLRAFGRGPSQRPGSDDAGKREEE
jgi:hypothetical protein